MKEDILEQLVDDYLQARGYFTRHNLKFRPAPGSDGYDKQKDSNHSDIDVIGLNPNLSGTERVVVVSCKSWQSGFDVTAKLRQIENEAIVGGREAWKGFRELLVPRWSQAFLREINACTGSNHFTYVTAVSFVKGSPKDWEIHQRFLRSLNGNPIKLLSLKEILDELDGSSSTTVASSAIGRILQLMKAAQRGEKYLIEEVQSEAEET